MNYLEIERLMCKDIALNLEQSAQDFRWGWTYASLYHLENAKMFCANLMVKLEETINEVKAML